MKNILMIVLCVGIFAFGCSESQKPDAVVIQGRWGGQELGVRPANSSPTLVMEGGNLEFRGGNTNEWYKATFTLREDSNPRQLKAVITDCPFPQYVGKTVQGIYKIEAGTLTFSANEPGNPSVPTDFQEKGTRQFVLKKQ